MIQDPGLSVVEQAGRRAFAGFRLQSLGQTTSTQDVARAAAREGAASGYCCLAHSQRAGRGRQGRSWVAPPGTALLASILLRVDQPDAARVPLVAGVALRAAVAASSGCQCLLKWPNDLLAGNRKLAGILCEVEPAAPGDGTAVVAGFGVNLRVPSFPPGVPGVSLHELVTAPPSPARLLAALLDELAPRLDCLRDEGGSSLLAEWTSHAAGLGAVMTASWDSGSVTGVAEGIDEDGALLLRGPAGTTRVVAGDAHLGAASLDEPPALVE